MALEIESCLKRAKADLDHVTALNAVQIKRIRELAAADSRADKARIIMLEAQLRHVQKWYRSPVFVAGVFATAAVVILALSEILIQASIPVNR